MFTLRIIFYGLIALVDDGRTEGALALLVNAHNHAASVWMMEGECTAGSCFRFPGNPEPAESLILSQTYQGNGFKLAWFLNQEHLSLSGIDGEDWEDDGNATIDDSDVFPTNAEESGDLAWVPRLTELAPNVGAIRDDCFDVPQSQGCPVIARFDASRGVVNSCHLVHEGNGAAAEIHAFDFRASANATPVSPPRAIADAVMVEILVNGPGLRLNSRPFTDTAVQNTADLAPQGGRITLIVSNNDYSGDGRHDHFAHYYDLTTQGSTLAARPVPHPRSKKIFSPGACEDVLDAFETALGVAVVDGVHNHRECDMVQYP